MWSININFINTKNIILLIDIKNKSFLKYLKERCSLYPIYLAYNSYWYNFQNPFKPFISAIPSDISYTLHLNRPIYIKHTFFAKWFVKKYSDDLIKQVNGWLKEEYEAYQSL